MRDVAIIVVTYNRPNSLERLLKSIVAATYDSVTVSLYISIDRSGAQIDPQTLEVAKRFKWNYGTKKILEQPQHLGLKNHILLCGDIANDHDAIIVLEDDVFVAPAFYSYAQSAFSYYNTDPQIGGISLFSYEYDESAFYPFAPLKDHSDVHFIQVPSSWGQLWTKEQWKAFKSWYEKHKLTSLSNLPEYAAAWGSKSWKKFALSYLIETGKYFVFPNRSYSTNFEEKGTNSTQTGLFASQLNLSDTPIKLGSLQASLSVYDAYFELIPAVFNQWQPQLQDYEYAVDLKGHKPVSEIETPYVLTTRKGWSSLLSFSTTLHPLELNVALAMKGHGIGLYKAENITETASSKKYQNYIPNFLLGQLQHHPKTVSFGVVLPVSDFNADALDMSLASIHTQACPYCVVVVCPEDIRSALFAYAQERTFKFEIHSIQRKTLKELLREGFSQCQQEINVWLRPGSVLTQDAFKMVAQASTAFPTTSWWAGVARNTDDSKGTVSKTAQWRWSRDQIKMFKIRGMIALTEAFFYKSDLSTLNHSIDNLEQYLFPSKTNLSLISLHLCRLSKTSIEAISNVETIKFKHRIFHYFFVKDIPYLRIFYRELAQLPPVLIYDPLYDSFYADNY